MPKQTTSNLELHFPIKHHLQAFSRLKQPALEEKAFKLFLLIVEIAAKN